MYRQYFPQKKKIGGGGVTVNVLMYNYQYCFNIEHNTVVNLYSNKKLCCHRTENGGGGGGGGVPPFGGNPV